MSLAHARGGGREEKKGRAPPLRCKHGAMPDVRMPAYSYSPLTRSSTPSAVLPPPLHTIVVADAYRNYLHQLRAPTPDKSTQHMLQACGLITPNGSYEASVQNACMHAPERATHTSVRTLLRRCG